MLETLMYETKDYHFVIWNWIAHNLGWNKKEHTWFLGTYQAQ